MDPLKLLVMLELQDKMSGALDTIKGKVSGFKGASVAGFAAAGAAAVSAGALFTGMATELNEGLAEVSTLIPGQTGRLNELKAAVQDLSVEYGTSSSGLTGGLYESISAFGDSADTVAILETNTVAAKAGVAEVGQAIALTSAVTKGYNTANAEGVKVAADLAFKTVELGQTNFPELAASIGKVVPIASSLSVSQEELFGVMATATGVTGGAAEVSTQLRGTLQALMAPTASMSGLFETMGVESGKALIEQEGLQGAVHAVVNAAQATGEPLTQFISSIEGVTLAQTLAGSQADNWASKTAAMESAAGSVDVAFGEMTGGVNASGFALDQYQAKFRVWGQNAGQAIIDFSGPLATGLLGVSQFGGSLAMMAPQITALMATMGGWSGVMGVVGGAAKVMWAAVTGPIGLTITAVAAIAGAWYLWGDEITAFVSGPWNSFLGAIEAGLTWLAPFASTIGIDLPTDLDSFKIGIEDATTASVEAAAGLQMTTAEAAAVGPPFREIADDTGPAVVASLSDVGAEAETTAEKFERLKIDGIQSFDDLSREAKSILQNRMVAELSAVAGTGGLDVSAAFSAGFLGDGPGGIMTELPAGTLRALEKSHGEALPKFAESGFDHGAEWKTGFDEVMSADNIFGSIARAFEGGGGWMGGIKSAGTQIGGSLFEGMKSGSLSKLPGIMGSIGGKVSSLWSGVSSAVSAIPFAGPILAAFGPQILKGIGVLGKKVWGGIKRMFGGPSEAEQLGRDMFAKFNETTAAALADNQTYHDTYNAHIRDGLDSNLAGMLASFITIGTENGKTYEQAAADYTLYQNAVGDGNTELMEQLEAEYGGMLEANTEAAAEAAEAQAALMERTYSTAVGAYDKAKQAGIDAYDSVYLKAIEAGAGEQAAVAKATAAQLAAKDKILAAEGEKFARLAAFEAALEAIRSGNAAGAAEAARNAAAESTAAWDTAMGVVEQADDAATDAMKGNADEVKDKAGEVADAVKGKADEVAQLQKDKAQEATAAMVGELEDYALAVEQNSGMTTDKWKTMTDDMAGKFGSMATQVKGDSEGAMNAIISDLGRLPDRITIPVNYDGRRTGDHSGGGGGEGEGMSSGSGGILDFGSGTPAVLHNREAVITEAGIMRMIAAAASGGRQSTTTSQRPMVLKVDRRVLGEVVEEERSRARNRLGVTRGV